MTGPNNKVVVALPDTFYREDEQRSPELLRIDAADLSSTLAALARSHQVPGAQLAVHHHGEMVSVEVGELQYETGQRVTRDAAFPIGSVTKTFTATLAMILVAEGDLELDAPLAVHVPELGDLGNEITLRQLLSHTSGLAAGPGTDVLSSSLRRYVLDHCHRQNLVLPPGAGFSYSSIGYVLVGHLIETITGMSWWDATESLLLRPLGIQPTFVGAPRRRPHGRPLATGHSVNTAVGRTRAVKQSLPPAEAPAGGLALSATDLLTLGLALLDNSRSSLLPSVYVKQMLEAVPAAEPFGSADGWGLGLALFGDGSPTCVGHFGALDGTDCNVRLDPVSGCVVAFTSNANTGLEMWFELVDELRRLGLPISNCSERQPMKRSMVPLSGCVGSYLNGNAELLVEATDAGALSLAVNGEAATELVFFEDLSFFLRDQSSIRGRFLQDPTTGAIEQIQVNLYAACRQPPLSEERRCQ